MDSKSIFSKQYQHNYRIALLLKEKLEKENIINLLQKNIKNLNKSVQEISKENEIHKNRINELNVIIKKLKIKEVKNDSELNELKKLNKNLINNKSMVIAIMGFSKLLLRISPDNKTKLLDYLENDKAIKEGNDDNYQKTK